MPLSGRDIFWSLGFTRSSERKESAAVPETWVQSLGSKDPLERKATHSSIVAWRIPWTEEPGGSQSIGLQRVGHSWRDLSHSTHLLAVLILSIKCMFLLDEFLLLSLFYPSFTFFGFYFCYFSFFFLFPGAQTFNSYKIS